MKAFIWVLSTLLVVFIGAGCGLSMPLFDATHAFDVEADTVNSTEVVYMQPSWAYSYDTVEDLIADSDLVILGTMFDVAAVNDISPYPEFYLPQTDYTWMIEKVLHGNLKEGVDMVTIQMMGGIIEGNEYKMIGNSPFVPGEWEIVFLKETAPEYYRLLHPQGRFILDQGHVHTLQHRDTTVNCTIPGFVSVSLEDFLAQYFPKP